MGLPSPDGHPEIGFPFLWTSPGCSMGEEGVFYDLVPGFYGLFPYGLVPGTYDLFLELAPYGLLFKFRPGP